MKKKSEIESLLAKAFTSKSIRRSLEMIMVFAGTMWGAFEYLDSRDDNMTKLINTVNTQNETLLFVKQQQKVMIDSMLFISDEVQGVKNSVSEIGCEVSGLKDSYIKFVKDNTQATELFMQYMDGVLYEKKNISLTVFPNPNQVLQNIK